MWRRTYLLLLLVRVYFALSPSYLHPDEHFQGPEVFAGRIYSYPSLLTWEFTSQHPIRSVFPLWPVYGLPMGLLKWFYNETGFTSPPADLVYYILRAGMFVMSFVFEDWAIHELVPTPRYRVPAVVLVASSYVTWTYQTHTFSNSLETLLVAWGPFSLVVLVAFGLLFTAVAILTDSLFYRSFSLEEAIRNPVITPLNNLRYNSNTLNLAEHGLHARYQHFLVNLPQLLGPAFVVLVLHLFTKSRVLHTFYNGRAVSAISATMILSIFPHQEPRFLLPCVPLLLTCIRPLRSRPFLVSWLLFNVAMGYLMGVYHQGGVVPTQLEIPSIITSKLPAQASSENAGTNVTVFWWKTYSPPLWLLGDDNNSNNNHNTITNTIDLMGMRAPEMISRIDSAVPLCHKNRPSSSDLVFLVAPRSATFLDTYTTTTSTAENTRPLRMQELYTYKKHISLDDLDFADDGVLHTIHRVIGRRGLSVWAVEREGCLT
ncbi:phosphatidylinositol glycan, class Z [Talaromyces islandicus]|uniref:Mannosyltransferase n=1 Tax=Talaromyces islandicus TaxID=28573 RepID=A0A0U1LZ35_TALIS|nr:phosphatidylinositol glycan, class Z [Talaromyces islandicus]